MSHDSFVLIIEDHPLYKQALISLLKLSFPDSEIVGANTAAEAFIYLNTQSPTVISKSVILLDLTLPGLSSLELIDKIKSDYSQGQILVISGSDDPLRVAACLGAGVSSFISKSTPPDRIVDLIGRALRGTLNEQSWISLDGPKSIDNLPKIHLTSRQVQVLQLVVKGMSNKQIAEELDTTEATSKAHVSAILRMLNVDSRTQAVLVAQKLGFTSQ
jgi:DNA-binding NarL/FixJ family response regulator